MSRAPFDVRPDSQFHYKTPWLEESLDDLIGQVQDGGVSLITGRSGSGKTTLCRMLMEALPAESNAAFITGHYLSPIALLDLLCEKFMVPRPQVSAGLRTCLASLGSVLARAKVAGRPNVLVVDDIERFRADTLQLVGLLGSMEVDGEMTLRIVLAGQGGRRFLAAPSGARRLHAKVEARYVAPDLSESEVRRYVMFRMRTAGLEGPMPFEQGAIREIAKFSGGRIRRVNLLTDSALQAGYANREVMVTEESVSRAATRLFGQFARYTPKWLLNWRIDAAASRS
ncbi:AAA family ATPase [Niveibacterium sp. SC-1]|uniref:ExeA family protein n=1 Tax=Niveibacterium sp. SC-1 TaxID=3135646 RepID=UPI00311FA881